MDLVVSTSEQSRIRELLEVLGSRATDPPRGMPPLVVTYLRVARWLRVQVSSPRSDYARALFTLEEHPEQVSRALEHLDERTISVVLNDVATFIAEARAPELSNAIASHGTVPPARLAALLAHIALPRCLALLARLGRTPDAQGAYVRSVTSAYLAARAAGAVSPTLSAVWHDLNSRQPDAVWGADLAAWDQLVAETHAQDEPAVEALSDAEYAAWWKLETLPLIELPWFDARAKV